MTGMSTNDTIAIVRLGSGLQVDTYQTTEQMLFAVAYKFCAENGGDLDKLVRLVDQVYAQVKADWHEDATA